MSTKHNDAWTTLPRPHQTVWNNNPTSRINENGLSRLGLLPECSKWSGEAIRRLNRVGYPVISFPRPWSRVRL
ncbi:MAG TPA: hypothetical protein PKZ24_10010, partial [Nitrospirales bacterium]|nr:hypothetical protein [Nitrospirales bacterium]